jgi:hypothetical protein
MANMNCVAARFGVESGDETLVTEELARDLGLYDLGCANEIVESQMGGGNQQ